jgi:hypothetical protein
MLLNMAERPSLGRKEATMMLRNLFRSGSTCLLLAAAWGCSVASAADASVDSNEAQLGAFPAADPPRQHKPPQVAFDACKDKTEGSACSVTFNEHTIEGTCRKSPEGDSALICFPAHPPGPPPEGR